VSHKHVNKLLFPALAVFISVIPAALAIDTIKPAEERSHYALL